MDGLMMDEQLTLDRLLDRAGTFFGSKEIVSRANDRSIQRSSWADVARRARQLGAALLDELGLEPGDRVATLCWNHHQHLEAYFGIPAAGLVLHTVNPRLHPNDLDYVLAAGGAETLLLDRSLIPVWQKASATVRNVIVVGGNYDDADRPRSQGPVIDYERLLGWAALPGRTRSQGPLIDERSAAAICFTSGTTGRPKGVVYSHRSMVLHTLALASLSPLGQRISEEDVICPVVPMFHANAWGFPHLAAMLGSKLVLPGQHLDPDSLIELFAGEQVTWAAGVPTVWLRTLPALKADQRHGSPSTLKAIATGGSSVPRTLIAEYRKLGIDVVQSWGMTETSPMAIATDYVGDLRHADDDTQLDVAAKAGIPLPLISIRARGDDGQLVPWNGKTMGQLEVRGPWVAGAYLPTDGQPVGMLNHWRWTPDGWFRTGDIVTIDPRGFVELRDRKEDLIKSGGEWISSVALEAAILEHPAVADVAVIAAPHPEWQERPVAVVVVGPEFNAHKDHERLCSELGEHLGARFAAWWLPDRYEFVDELPRAATGKVSKVDLRATFAR